MKVVSNDGLTKLVQLVKDNFIKNTDIEATGEVTLATVATSGQYSDLTGTPTIDQTYNASSTNAQSGTAVSQAVDSVLPSQTSQSGKFLTTNGTAVSWADVDALPSQSGQNGKFLTTNGTSASWDNLPVDQIYSGTSTNAQSGVAVKSAIDAATSLNYKIAGRVNFSELPQSLTDEMIGNVYSVNDPFTSDSRFVINGANYTQGTNVVVIETTEDIIYYGYYSSDSGETIYTLVAPTSLASNDKVYSQVQGEMVEVGYVSYCEAYDDYCTIYSWIDNDSNEHYDYNEYNESYNISVLGTTPVLRYDSLGGANTSASINTTDNYVPYRSDSTTFSDSSLIYNSSAMAFTGKLHIGSSSPSSHASKGKLTIYDNTPSQQVSSIALLNYGGGGGCGVSIDMYNTSANGGIPSGRFGVIDNGNYSGYLQLQVKKSGSPNNPLLPAMNIVPLPVTNSLTTCVSFGQDEFNRVLFDLHKPESYVYFSDSDKRWSGSGTTYTQSGPTTFNGRLIVAVGDIVSFDNFSTEARVVDIVSSSSTLQITTDVSLGSVSNKNIYVKKAYFKITDENYNTKVLIDPYGKMCIGKTKPDYDLDVAGNINASTDIKINGVSVALPSQSGNNGKFLTTNGTTASWSGIDGSNVSYINDLSVSDGITLSITCDESLGDSVGGSFDADGTFTKASYKVSEQAQLNQITDNNTLVAAIGINDYSIGKLTSLTTSAKTNLVSAINELVTNKVESNTAITGATKCKITYDSKGLVTSGADLSASDIPDITLSKISDVTASATEVNVLDGITASTTELNYVDGVTSNIQTQLNDKQETLVSGTNIKTINNTSILGSGNIDTHELPSQSGQSGKYLTTNGTSVSWSNTPEEIPSQTGQSGKFLTTNGTVVSWADVDALPSQSGNNGKFLTTNGTTASWVDAPEELPSQSGESGKVLTTNGTTVSWTNFPTVDQTYDGTSTNAQSGVAVKSAIDAAISSTYKAAGSVAFANLPTLSSSIEGYVYNVTDAFTTTSDFVEGAGKSYPAGTNVVCIDVGSSTYKWDVLAGFVDLSGYQTLIDSTHKLSADLVDDTSTTNKFVTTSDKTTWSGKQDAITGAATTITANDLTASKALISNSSGKVAVSNVTDTELGYLSGVTSAIQTQINNKITANTAITGATKCKITYDSNGLVTAGADITLSDVSDITATASEVNVLDGITASTTELNYVDGVTSAIQTQLDNKVEYAMVIVDYTS